jgi:hypothetical protein
MNPTAPNLHATIKLHKPNTPLRPEINWKNAPAYKLAIHLTTTLQNYLHLPYTYNVHNSIHLITDLKTIELNKNIRKCSFDIENMYTNIPILDTINIISNILKDNPQNNEKIQKEILYITQTILFVCILTITLCNLINSHWTESYKYTNNNETKLLPIQPTILQTN